MLGEERSQIDGGCCERTCTILFLGVGVVFKSRLSGSGDGEFGPSRKALN